MKSKPSFFMRVCVCIFSCFPLALFRFLELLLYQIVFNDSERLCNKITYANQKKL